LIKAADTERDKLIADANTERNSAGEAATKLRDDLDKLDRDARDKLALGTAAGGEGGESFLQVAGHDDGLFLEVEGNGDEGEGIGEGVFRDSDGEGGW